MKYKVTYTMQREVSVLVEIEDKDLNNDFDTLGEIKSDDDFIDESDSRWKIEESAYNEYSSGKIHEECEDTIVNRTITKYED